MSKSTMIHARIEPELKSEVESVFHDLGLNMTSAVTLFLKQVVIHQGLPFSVIIPNTETVEAMEEALKNRDEPSPYKSKKEFFADLLDGIDD